MFTAPATPLMEFQSTPPRGGRPAQGQPHRRRRDFNPRPPRRGRQAISFHDLRLGRISIHAPREGGDLDNQPPPLCFFLISIHAPARGATGALRPGASSTAFQSTPLRGGATVVHRTGYAIDGISIHAPREGGDPENIHELYSLSDFNPRPREGGDAGVLICQWHNSISIHAPARGATHRGLRLAHFQPISIHAPARGATLWPDFGRMRYPRFQSTPPRGGRLQHLPHRP